MPPCDPKLHYRLVEAPRRERAVGIPAQRQHHLNASDSIGCHGRHGWNHGRAARNFAPRIGAALYRLRRPRRNCDQLGHWATTCVLGGNRKSCTHRACSPPALPLRGVKDPRTTSVCRAGRHHFSNSRRNAMNLKSTALRPELLRRGVALSRLTSRLTDRFLGSVPAELPSDSRIGRRFRHLGPR
jgi:hypothetical protein